MHTFKGNHDTSPARLWCPCKLWECFRSQTLADGTPQWCDRMFPCQSLRQSDCVLAEQLYHFRCPDIFLPNMFLHIGARSERERERTKELNQMCSSSACSLTACRRFQNFTLNNCCCCCHKSQCVRTKQRHRKIETWRIPGITFGGVNSMGFGRDCGHCRRRLRFRRRWKCFELRIQNFDTNNSHL